MFSSLPDMAAKGAELRPQKIALAEPLTGRALTYAELDGRAARAATALAQAGVGPQDRVALLCRNRIESFELLFAAGKLGAILVPLNWRKPAGELKPVLADCEPSVLLYGREDAGAAVSSADGVTVTLVGLDDMGGGGYSARLQAARPHPGREWWPAREAWYLLYTSGTTGPPKAVIQTYQMAWANTVNIGQAVGITAADRTYKIPEAFVFADALPRNALGKVQKHLLRQPSLVG